MIRSWPCRNLLSLLALLVLTSGCADSGRESLIGPQFSTAPGGYALVNGDDGDGISDSRIIGPEGGTLAVESHVLVVPAGAVTGPTVFVMQLTHAGAIGVELSATSLASAALNDVGARAFSRPVTLRLSFDKATRNVNPGRLTVAWARSDGGIEPVPSSVDMAAKIVSGELRHFSGYVLVD